MNYSKSTIFCIIILCSFVQVFGRPQVPAGNSVAGDKTKLANNARPSLDLATGAFSNNLIQTLTNIAGASASVGTNVSNAAQIMVRGLITNTFQLGGVVAYMPRLIFLDGPTQFIEVLRLIRSNQVRLPTDIDSAIDTLMSFANQYRHSGIGDNLNPAITFLPNLFKGVGDFMVTLFDSLFNFIA